MDSGDLGGDFRMAYPVRPWVEAERYAIRVHGKVESGAAKVK